MSKGMVWDDLDLDGYELDPGVARLSLAGEGFWWRCLRFMRRNGRTGVLSGAAKDFARIARCESAEALDALHELDDCRVADVVWGSNGHVTVTNRRMAREHKCGGNARLRVQRHRERRPCNADVTGEVTGDGGCVSRGRALELKAPIERVVKPFSLEELKLKLEGDEREFCAAARQVVGARDWEDGRREHPQGDGSKWRLRWRHGASRGLCVRVMLDLIERGKSGGGAADTCWQEFGGKKLDVQRLEESE